MNDWLDNLAQDPIPQLIASGDAALIFIVRRDLLGKPSPSSKSLSELPEAARIINKQTTAGCWKYHGRGPQRQLYVNYNLLETFRSLSILVSKYQLTREYPTIQKAAEYVFNCQHPQGDIRGILGNQYMPYYHAVILEQLILAGYEDDPRVLNGLEWFETFQQSDGGWLISAQTVPPEKKTERFWKVDPQPADRSLPSSHQGTGMSLRAFAVHPVYRAKHSARMAALFLSLRFFKPDCYNDRKSSAYWTKYQFPFWWSNLLTALDSLSLTGFHREDENLKPGLAWFTAHQEPDGLWPTGFGEGKKAEGNRNWIGLAVCRMSLQFGYQG